MIDFPKIRGIKWLSTDCPDLVAVKVMLEDKVQRSLGIAGMKIDEIVDDYYIDLSKLAGVRNWYPTEDDIPAKNECMVDIDGVSSFVASLSKEALLEAWLFYKKNR